MNRRERHSRVLVRTLAVVSAPAGCHTACCPGYQVTRRHPLPAQGANMSMLLLPVQATWWSPFKYYITVQKYLTLSRVRYSHVRNTHMYVLLKVL
jgi:hypothetical protein